MKTITDVFNDYLEQFGSVDIAESEFHRSVQDDDELKAAYKEWCETVGSSEKRGFLDYCDEYIDSQNDIWNSLSDYNDE